MINHRALRGLGSPEGPNDTGVYISLDSPRLVATARERGQYLVQRFNFSLCFISR